ncbi:hypothetical protein HNV12_06995 [Methanococcoides sp. SA1]|nr:hypothetical protein [Methanococcoides sp. SA1]
MKNDVFSLQRNIQSLRTKFAICSHNVLFKRPITFIRNNNAYIPFSVIGIFVILGAVFASAYFLQTDYEIAQTIYTTERTDPETTALGFASADLSRCLDYAGMEALKWKGEHPIIQPLSSSARSSSKDDFMLTAVNHDLEAGDILKVRIDLPSDVWESISSIWKDQSIILKVKDSNGKIVSEVNYGEAVSFWRKVSFEELILLPKDIEAGYGTVELECGGNVKATDWFSIAMDPIKDITAKRFNELITGNYQDETYVHGRYAINIEPDVKPYQIVIEGINGTLDRQIGHDNNTYIIYYKFSIKDLNYTFVDIETGERVRRTMDVSTLVTSREPLLEELTNEYERSLNSAVASNIVLGTMNIRSFTYGPWQHYANGPLNIITDPSLASAVNLGTVYTQKRTFDSVDPMELMYTTYYSGKVFYEDVHGTASSYGMNGSANLTAISEELANSGSFSADVKVDVSNSMDDDGTSFEQIEERSEITVSAADYIPSVIDGWAFEDHAWKEKDNDLIHNVAREIYSADVQAQVERDGFNKTEAIETATSIEITDIFQGTHAIEWDVAYENMGTHVGALYPSYPWNHSMNATHGETLTPTIVPPKGTLLSWELTSTSVSRESNVVEVTITPSFRHNGNDELTNVMYEDGYRVHENHSFDWTIDYDVKYVIRSNWKIAYTYSYKYKWKKFIGWGHNNAGKYKRYKTIYSTGTGSATAHATTVVTNLTNHAEIETENLSIIYHKRPPTGIYTGLDRYSDPIDREYRITTMEVDGKQLEDKACSDAADKYADQYVDIYEIENRYDSYTDGHYLPQYTLECDVPEWLHRKMADEVLEMLTLIEADDPAVTVSLIDNLGDDPTLLRYEAAKELANDLEDDTDIYVDRTSHLTDGKMLVNSDAARYIAKNEAYLKLEKEIRSQNQKLNADLNGYILDKLKKVSADIPGLNGNLLNSVTEGSFSLFNNPAISMAGNALATEMGVIDTMTITGMPENKYNWTEEMTLIVDQEPNYLYHDPDFDLNIGYELKDPKGATIYPLGVRNTCVFSTGIADDIAGMLEDASSPAKEATSQMVSKSIADLNSEVNSLEQNLSEQALPLDTTTLDTHVNGLTRTYSKEMRNRIPEKIAEQVNDDPVVSAWIDSSSVVAITTNYLDGLSNREIINASAEGSLSLEMSERLKSEVRRDNFHLTGDEMEAVLNRLDTDVRIGTAEGVSVVIVDNSAMIDASFAAVNDELQDLTDASYAQMNEAAAEKVAKRLEKTMEAVPMGLPVLPPNWVFTLNVWTYEVVGKYEYFKVTDGDNEVILNMLTGHEGQVYVREEANVYHPFKTDNYGYLIELGDNEIIMFKLGGYAATIVGTGPKGVGDKIGGRTEKSIGYDDLFNEFEMKL